MRKHAVVVASFVLCLLAVAHAAPAQEKSTDTGKVDQPIDVLATGDEGNSLSIELVAIYADGRAFDGDTEDARKLARGLELRKKSYEHSWWCNMFNICHTKFSGRFFVIDTSNGAVQKWNLIESVSRDGCRVSWNYTKYYWSAEDATHGKVGWGERNGRSRSVNARLKFYAEDGRRYEWHISSGC